jgi:hypothetical protein
VQPLFQYQTRFCWSTVALWPSIIALRGALPLYSPAWRACPAGSSAAGVGLIAIFRRLDEGEPKTMYYRLIPVSSASMRANSQTVELSSGTRCRLLGINRGSTLRKIDILM